MPATDYKINSAINSVQALPNRPTTGTAASVKAAMDGGAETVRQSYNQLCDYIDLAIALKSELQGIILGQIVDGTLTDAKLSNTAGQIKDAFNTHKNNATIHLPSSLGSALQVLRVNAGGTATEYVDFPQNLTQIGSVTITTTPTLNITFSSIPSTYKALFLIHVGRSNAAATIDTIKLRLNSDSGSNYDYQNTYASATATTSAEALAGNFAFAGFTTANTASANLFSITTITIPQYANTAFEKSFTVDSGLKQNTTTGGMRTAQAHSFWRSTAAIDTVTLFPSVGTSWAVGTTAILYGIR